MKLDNTDYTALMGVATKHLQCITGQYDVSARLYHCDSHLTIEDIVSSSMEKLLLASPEHVTAALIKVISKNTYFDEVRRKKRLQYTDKSSNGESMEDDNVTPIEETLEEDVYDHISDLKEQLHLTLNDECKDVLTLLVNGHNYEDIASAMNISKSYVKNYVKQIKDAINDF